jgi:hypothetical protein
MIHGRLLWDDVEQALYYLPDVTPPWPVIFAVA